MTVTRTRNTALVEKLLRSHPALWKAAGGVEDAALPNDENTYYLLCRDDEHGILGACIFHPEEQPGVYAAHASFLSKHWGKNHRCDAAASSCIAWMFENTDAQILRSSIPDEYLPVQLFAERIGMTCTALEDDCKHYEIVKHG